MAYYEILYVCAYTLSVCLFALFKTKDTNLVHAGMLTQMIRATQDRFHVSLHSGVCRSKNLDATQAQVGV